MPTGRVEKKARVTPKHFAINGILMIRFAVPGMRSFLNRAPDRSDRQQMEQL
jgi:hypothetical protein